VTNLGSEQALALVRLPDTFAEGAWDKCRKQTFDFIFPTTIVHSFHKNYIGIFFVCVMFCAQSCSFQKNNHRMAPTESLMMATSPIVQYNPYHQPALLDLYWTSVRIHPLLCYHQKTIILIIAIANQHHALSTTAHLEPHQLHTYSMSQAYHTTHAPVLEVMSFGRHKVFRGFESALLGIHWSTIFFVICFISPPYAL